MVVVEEDVKAEEAEMEMEVVAEEVVKVPSEELEVLVVLALMDQTQTVSGMFLRLLMIFLVVRPDMILGNTAMF